MPEFVRVRLSNGVQKSLPADHPAVTAEGVEVILDKPALDPVTGVLIPDKTPVANGDSGYDAMTVAALKAEVASRNEARDEADHIPGNGNKSDLVAALQADDAAHTA